MKRLRSRLKDVKAAVQRILSRIEQEAKTMPILNDILDHKVLGREFKKGELTVLRRQLEERFGMLPSWAEDRLIQLSARQLLELSVRVLNVKTLEELFG